MILTPLKSVAYRVHDPKWSYAPTGGAGASSHGGRANRPGVNAHYLSLELATALAEYHQLDALMSPSRHRLGLSATKYWPRAARESCSSR